MRTVGMDSVDLQPNPNAAQWKAGLSVLPSGEHSRVVSSLRVQNASTEPEDHTEDRAVTSELFLHPNKCQRESKTKQQEETEKKEKAQEKKPTSSDNGASGENHRKI